MGFITRAFQPRAAAPIVGGVSYVTNPFGDRTADFPATSRAYTGNEIVFSALDLLMTSASEPHVMGRRWRRNRAEIRNEMDYLHAMGVQNRSNNKLLDAMMVRNGYWEKLEWQPQGNAHPLVELLNNPAHDQIPRDWFWSQIVLDRYLAGKAFVLKARYTDGLLAGAVGELWRLRPDRVKPIPGDMSKGEEFIKGYEYTIDAQNKRFIPTRDIMHFRGAPHPTDPYDSISPLIAALPRVAIDSYQRNFLSTFYQRGGAGVGGVLNIKGMRSLDDKQKQDYRDRFRRMFSGGQFDILVTTAEDVSYEGFSLDRGLRDALPKEIDAVNEARISMVLHIPPGVLGLLIGMETSSYANQRQAWQILWDLVMTPLLSRFDSVINQSLTPEFSGIDEVYFDLSDIPALQEDEEALQERARKNWSGGIASFDETRVKVGLPPEVAPDALFLVPTTGDLTPYERLGEAPEPPVTPANPPQGDPNGGEGAGSTATALLAAPPRQLGPGRPRLENDPGARAIYDEAMSIRERNPHLSWEQTAARVSVSVSTLREYRRRFEQ